MLFRLDHGSAVSLATQIVDQVRTAIIDGTLQPGERLPPARDLATALDVNMHTVLRAYGLLRDAHLIDMRQGRGAWVRPDVDATAARLRVAELAEQFLAEANKIGLSRAEILHLIGES
ncbi:GntR family transcriptional regulator [Plantibacter sp. Mn2098]|uniref:GntR family transcriptional regulator n=1 Tax=Plantibacter sp. Mn2098 TaxID=3395266 RepID=UPI003BEE7EC9